MKISVYITSYNQNKFLKEAIDSVLNQTVTPYQVIIVDDCSSDGSRDIIAAYASRHQRLITPIYHETNTGVAQTRIDALQAVSGDYVTYVDGDDRLLPTKLEKESTVMKGHPKAKIVFSNTYYINEAGRRIGLWADNERPAEGNVFFNIFTNDFPAYTPFRNELVDFREWEKIGFHDPHLTIYEDFDMRIRLTKTCPAVYCEAPLNEYRLHKKGLSTVKREEQYNAISYVYHKNKHLLSDLDVEAKDRVRQKLSEWIIKLFRDSLQTSREEEMHHLHYKEAELCSSLLNDIGAHPWDFTREQMMTQFLLKLGELKILEHRLSDIQNSLSWKITSPIRKLGDLFDSNGS